MCNKNYEGNGSSNFQQESILIIFSYAHKATVKDKEKIFQRISLHIKKCFMLRLSSWHIFAIAKLEFSAFLRTFYYYFKFLPLCIFLASYNFLGLFLNKKCILQGWWAWNAARFREMGLVLGQLFGIKEKLHCCRNRRAGHGIPRRVCSRLSFPKSGHSRCYRSTRGY